ncbi:MAG: 30S ribosomal protein S6 [Bdellovibrionales bacterium]|nr:30S ribosomal protein S6 [Bdellovibrionales bacterium]
MSNTEVIRPYEGVILINADATEDVQKNLFKKNKQIIADHKGELKVVETWGKRALGNPIGKNNKAIYFYTTFTANPDAVAELERTMRINEDVVRFMHTRLDDGTDLTKHLQTFKDYLTASAQKQKDFESKMAKKAERFTENRKKFRD